MNLLAIEISSRVGSLALGTGEGTLEAEIATPREQTERILVLIETLLTSAGIGPRELDALAFGRGPGSFTGLRVAAAVAQGIALSCGVPLVAVSSLAALAERARREHGVERALVCVDARMGEVYWAELGGAPPVERLTPPERVTAPQGTDWSAVGDGFAAYPGPLAAIAAAAEAVYPALLPGARDVLALAAAEVAAGRFVAPEAALPVYLRDESAWG